MKILRDSICDLMPGLGGVRDARIWNLESTFWNRFRSEQQDTAQDCTQNWNMVLYKYPGLSVDKYDFEDVDEGNVGSM